MPNTPQPRAAENPTTPLFTDLYELTMTQAYLHQGLATQPATFSLYLRTLPQNRNYLLAAGIEPLLDDLQTLHFTPDDLAYLHSLNRFTPDFLHWLERWHFTGAVRGIPEGTPCFQNEPLLEVHAPLGQAQLIETLALNRIHFATLIASKGARAVHAAQGRTLVDFGARRAHGIDAADQAARALYLAGFDATSNLHAGRRYGIPVAGTMAHSYVQAHAGDPAAFRAFVHEFPDTTLLVDTYDTPAGVQAVINLAAELRQRGEPFRVRALRIDSGDLAAEAHAARARLDAAGLHQVELFASGGLDEWSVAELVAAGAPYTGFGLGTRLVTSADAPSADAVYKLVQLSGEGRLKLSPGKETLPGPKQVWRYRTPDGLAARDLLTPAPEGAPEIPAPDGAPEVPASAAPAASEAGEAGEAGAPEPLLIDLMRDGRRLPTPDPSLEAARHRAATELARLPARLLTLTPATPPYEVATAGF